MNQPKPWLGLYCIVRNAEKTIETLLNSIPDVFDEIVLVDTGSIDKTTQLVEEHFGLAIPAAWDGEARECFPQAYVGGVRLVLARFKWVDDFSAARQFSFDLGTAKWRCYLDADDDATDFKRKLRATMERTELEHPETNCISVKYDYVPNEMAQDTIRIVRWADGWKWEDPVHEHMVRTDAGNVGRVISKYVDVWVKHKPAEPQAHANQSFARNVLIAEKAFQEATRPEKRALWAYYLGNYAYEVGHIDLAREYYRKMADGLGRNNITCEGLCRWARMEIKQGNIEKAIDLAGEAIAKAPELPDGYATLGVALNLSGAPYRAAGIFDMLRTQPRPPLETQHDAIWLDGVANGHAAQAYYQIGRVSDANMAIEAIPQSLLSNQEVIAANRPTHVSLTKTEGFNRLRALWEFLIWDTEPLKAKRLLEELCPAALSDSPQVRALIRSMGPKLSHMNDWAAYQRAYAAIPELPYHVPKEHHGWTLEQGRARMVRQWAENQPHEGPPIEVLVIGVQDGIIESAMLAANPRVVLTACDVAPQASVGINEMISKFPGRVKTHALVRDHYDWFPEDSKFDAVNFFEVIEHLPEGGDEKALRVIREHLKPEGQLFVSTPIAAFWVEQYLANMKDPRPWWHVRAHNPSSLWKLFQATGYTGSLLGLNESTLFLAKMQPNHLPPGPEIAIYVYPMRPMAEGFDPFSPKLGHVGGSEEAVIHLSAALAKKGARVTVYTDMPQRMDTLLVHEGTQWRNHSELDVPGLKGALLVWRAPQMAAEFKLQNPKLRVLNWLHDTHYNATPAQYEAVDGTIALSRFHGEALSRFDGYHGRLEFASNGIVPADFPEPDESKRDPHACIYAAAPERGLEFLLEEWPKIRAAVPDATLRVYYSWTLTEKMLERRPDAGLTALLAKLRAGLESLKDQGVTYFGGVDHKTLNEAYRTSGVWTYPPVNFLEISCISAMKAMASGCWPVIIPTGALTETCSGAGIHTTPEEYAERVIWSMKNASCLDRAGLRTAALEKFGWDKAADKFLHLATSKSERITIYAGAFGRKFDGLGSADGRPLGGSEEAVIAMAMALSDRGEEVFVYCPLPEGGARLEGGGSTIQWRDSKTFTPAGPHGTLLAWRCPAMVHKLKGNGYPVILWLMDPEYGAHPWEYGEADDVVFLTESHKDIIQRKDGYADGGSTVHIGLPELPGLNQVPRWQHDVMWATSPDRGLLEFLRDTWPEVVAAVPDAKLHVFYGLEPLEKNGKADLAAEIRKLLFVDREPRADVVYHGGVTDEDLYNWYATCGVFAYRAVGFEETQSLALCKALAMGCWPVTNTTGCLKEITDAVDAGLSVPDRFYAHELIETLKHPMPKSVREKMAATARRIFSVESMVGKMLAVIDGVRENGELKRNVSSGEIADAPPIVTPLRPRFGNDLLVPRPSAPGAA